MHSETDEIDVKQAIEEAVDEIRKPWVSSSDASLFSSYRNLAKYARELKLMKLTLRDYASSDEICNPEVVDAVYDYVAQAYSTYLRALYSWIDNANEKKRKQITVPAANRVQKLLSEYDTDIDDKLKRYRDKAKLSPEERSKVSRNTSLSQVISTMSVESQEVVGRLLQEHENQLTQMNNQLIDALVSAEMQKRKAEKKIFRLEKECETLREQVESTSKEKELMEKKACQEHEKRRKQEDLNIKERGEILKQQFQLQKELKKYKTVASEVMFPDASHARFLNTPAEEGLLSSSSSPQRNLSKRKDVLTDLKESFPYQMSNQPSTSKGILEKVSLKTPLSYCPYEPSEKTQPFKQEPNVQKGDELAKLRWEVPLYVPLAGRRQQAPSFSAQRQLSEFKFTPWEEARPHVINDESGGLQPNAPTMTSANDSATCETPAFAYPWKRPDRIKEKTNAVLSEDDNYLNRGRFYPKYYAATIGGDIGSKEEQRRFSGKRSDYPMFRQKLIRDYNLLWHSNPYALLQKIANSVSDNVYEHIKNAWVMRNPQNALDRIWEILEEFYGDPNGLLENAIWDIKWEKGSLSNKVSSLQLYRTKLRNLQSVAKSIGMENELSRPKLIFRVVDCFNPTLNSQFVYENKNIRSWRFETVLKFIDEQVSTLQYRERESYDISAMIDDEKPRNKLKSVGWKQSKRINSINTGEVQRRKEKGKSQDNPNERKENERKFYTKHSRESQSQRVLCVFHPFSNHNTEDCRQFLGKSVEERRRFVKSNGLCFYCLRKHLARYCNDKIPCKKCGRGHSTLLHQEDDGRVEYSAENSTKGNITVKESKQSKPSETETRTKNINTASCITPYLNSSRSATVPIMVLTAIDNSNTDSETKFFALLDTGADVSICSRKLAETLYGWKPNDNLSIRFLEKSPESYVCMKKTLSLRHGNDHIVEMKNVAFIDAKLPYSECLPNKKDLRKYDLDGQDFPVAQNEQRIDMILGAPDIHKFKILDECIWEKSLPDEPLIGIHALGTIFWGMKKDSCHGYICAMHSEKATRSYAEQILDIVATEHNISEEECLECMPLLAYDITRYYCDQLILDPECEKMIMSKEDESILSFYNNNVTEIVDDYGQRRLQLPLPWKSGYPISIPESYDVAKRRLTIQTKRMSEQEDRRQKYKKAFEKMKLQGQAEIIADIELRETEKPIHYITHFATEQEKFRVVYNGALKINDVCLNDMLHRGPMFLESLVGILMRFRQYKFAITADIQNMFFQVSLHPKDRDMLRFFPFTGEKEIKVEDQWRFTVMPYGLICVPSIAGFCIKYTARKNYAKVPDEYMKKIETDFYVDDLIISVESLNEAKDIISYATELLATTGFVLTKFASNSKEVLTNLKSECLAPSLRTINFFEEELPCQKTLGICWDAETDNF